ncbi:hypothetical protein EUGRSUZ_L01068 [Eucalyptus grandis]|uniref:Uncharacterized protein n=1 Tax=Eucalyptus grandis TaxID=71139 RepID=A0A058ZW37_EUCGR|nr:hypothetical protein EUGRSUZ_L01068 [Eucalyptus grandis]
MEVEAGATVTFSENAYRIRRYQAPSRLTLNDDRIRGRKSPTAALRGRRRRAVSRRAVAEETRWRRRPVGNQVGAEAYRL